MNISGRINSWSYLTPGPTAKLTVPTTDDYIKTDFSISRVYTWCIISVSGKFTFHTQFPEYASITNLQNTIKPTLKRNPRNCMSFPFSYSDSFIFIPYSKWIQPAHADLFWCRHYEINTKFNTEQLSCSLLHWVRITPRKVLT